VDREILVQEYRTIVSHSYPYINSLLNDCYLKILDGCVTSISNSYSYLGIYYPGINGQEIILYEKELKEIAKDLGIIEVVVINAKKIIREPMSCLKKENPRLWLELYWISSKVKANLD
jgi:glyoxylate carboligase